MPSLFEKLQKIQEEILKQIPSATNALPDDLSKALSDNKSDEENARAFLEYFISRRNNQEIYNVCRFINEEYAKLRKSRQAPADSPLTEEEKQAFKTLIVNGYTEYFAKEERLQTAFSSPLRFNWKQFAMDITAKLDGILARVYSGEILTLDDKKMQEEFDKGCELTEHREVMHEMMQANMALLENNGMDDDKRNVVLKSNCFIIGVYMDKTKAENAFCEEYACLALQKIYEQRVVDAHTYIEKVSIAYSDSEGHTFLILNRDPRTQLNDISTWNPDAILFDPWKKLLCKASEFDAAKYGHSYPKGSPWKIEARFDQNDYEIYRHLVELDNYFYISGNELLETRTQAVMDEYELTSLDTPEFAALREFLYQVLKEVWPDNFKMQVKLYLTTGGNEFIRPFSGLAEPGIAIHRDFLFNITPKSGYTLDELKYGMAYAIHYIKKNGLGITDKVKAIEQARLDREVVLKNRNGTAAISYLRKSIEFRKGRNSAPKMPSLIKSSILDVCASLEQRIRNVMTLIAQDKKLNVDADPQYLDDKILAPLLNVTRRLFFVPEFLKCKNKIDQLKFLTASLPELRKELLPYELTLRPSVRVEEFLYMLPQLKINFDNAAESEAVDNFINAAYDLRIPAFERLYLAVLGVAYDENNTKDKIRPLGYFKVFNSIISRFVNADSFDEARAAAVALKEMYAKLATHFGRAHRMNLSAWHLQKFRKEHGGRPPKDAERFFGSTLALRIKWDGFFSNPLQDDLPWNKHIEWLKQNNGRVIEQALSLLGVNLDQRAWAIYTPLELFQRAEQKVEPVQEFTGELEQYSDHNSVPIRAHTVRYLANQHKPNSSMFDGKKSFEEAFKAFYDENWPALIAPGVEQGTNATVAFMLAKFAEIAATGTPEEKQTVKSFFLGRDDYRDFNNLKKALDKLAELYHCLKPESDYVRFVLKQEYKNKKFNLFTPDERLALLPKMLYAICETPPLDWIDVCGLRHADITLDCLAEMLPVLAGADLHTYAVSSLVEYHIKKFGKYNLLSPPAIRLAGIVFDKHFLYEGAFKHVLKSFVWTLPDHADDLPDVNIHQLIFLYRSYDYYFLFSSRAEKDKLGHLLMEKVRSLGDFSERVKALEALLFVSKDSFITPLTDIDLANQAMRLWVDAIAGKHGKDDASPAYRGALTGIIDRVFKGASGRDQIRLLSSLADRIESQRELSDYIGMRLEPDKYFNMPDNTNRLGAISMLAAVSSYLGEDKNDQARFLAFLSSPLNERALADFVNYLITHKKAKKIREIMLGKREAMRNLPSHEEHALLMTLMGSLYGVFWDRKLEERAVVIDYLLIPPSKVINENEAVQAFDEALDYVAKRLFSKANIKGSDDEFALSFLKGYLETSDKFIRSLLIAGMLVASNELSGKDVGVGKKLALLCENRGPAFIKLAQAIHSNPSTPEHIRRDLDHIKGRANPPYRWDIWRMCVSRLSAVEVKKIRRMGRTLGSASFNVALLVETDDGEQVLTMLRENAAEDARAGFDQLRRTLDICDHPRLVSIRSTAKSMIDQGQAMSELEMDDVKSQRQYEIAQSLYHRDFLDGRFRIHIYPSAFLAGGNGFRFIQLVHGVEFNDLPEATSRQLSIKKMAAKAILKTEFVNILSGRFFDSDRHGNQLRIDVREAENRIDIGLYDFGEMALDMPTNEELGQLAAVINDIPMAVVKAMSFGKAFDHVLSQYIDNAVANYKPAAYLMRVRKALLALQDFQKKLSMPEMVEVLLYTINSRGIHPEVKGALTRYVKLLDFVDSAHKCVDTLFSPTRWFNSCYGAGEHESSPVVRVSARGPVIKDPEREPLLKRSNCKAMPPLPSPLLH